MDCHHPTKAVYEIDTINHSGGRGITYVWCSVCGSVASSHGGPIAPRLASAEKIPGASAWRKPDER